jgi:hypothetical protein
VILHCGTESDSRRGQVNIIGEVLSGLGGFRDKGLSRGDAKLEELSDNRSGVVGLKEGEGRGVISKYSSDLTSNASM